MTARLFALTLRVVAVAGIIGVVRQRREAAEVRSGARAATGPSGSLEPVRAQHGLAERIATWLPERPRSLATRTAVAIWTAPSTAVGLAIAFASRARVRWDDVHGCLVATGARGPSGRALRAVGADANAIGQIVLARSESPSPALLTHEAMHVRQAERLGPLLLPLYAVWSALHGYRDNPFERAARRAPSGT